MDIQSERSFKNQLYKQFERVGKALGSSRRLEILDVLAQGEQTVEVIAARTGMSIANASQHLRLLLNSRMVDVRRQGSYAYYRLANKRVLAVWHAVRKLAVSQLSEITPFVSEYASGDKVSFQEANERNGDPNFLVIDVRPHSEYRAGRIRGAVSIPIEELQQRLGDIPKNAELAVYCRGPYSSMSRRAEQILKDNGFNVKRLEAGLPEWKVQGLPTTRNPLETGR